MKCYSGVKTYNQDVVATPLPNQQQCYHAEVSYKLHQCYHAKVSYKFRHSWESGRHSLATMVGVMKLRGCISFLCAQFFAKRSFQIWSIVLVRSLKSGRRERQCFALN